MEVELRIEMLENLSSHKHSFRSYISSFVELELFDFSARAIVARFGWRGPSATANLTSNGSDLGGHFAGET
ncbi:hypothetical protein QRB36_13490 [Mycobacterium marseillense]|uniref:hypothetical protein n=1 Tax=Mycobacterium avium complex (MAC) TaxID=120793 RepID=UPI0005C939AC|nr:MULTISPECIES: hypothetical protein [Mycobacterium avium complex (MAC)]MDM3975179.1 hypothetical protein [Mycobacterium marseillense]